MRDIGFKLVGIYRRTLNIISHKVNLAVLVLKVLKSRVVNTVCLLDNRFNLAGLNTPLAMLVIGFYLAGANFRRVISMPSAYLAAAVRLLVYPLAMVALLFPLRTHFPREMMLALVTAASAPVAAMVSMFASKFSRDVDLSVGLVSGTTLLSIITMPPVIALAMEVL